MSSLNGIGVGIPYATYEGTGSITDSSTFYAPLETSLILQRGTGNPTWSRATKAWGFNELGYLEELASGCAFFGGARLVRNTVRTTSEDFSNAAWIKFGSITAPSANIIVCANATSAQYINQGGTLSLIPGQKLSYCIRAKKMVGGVDFIQIAGQSTTHGVGQFCNISLIDGTYSATGCSPVVTPLGSGAYDISVVFTCVAAGFDVYNIVFTNALSSTRLEAFVGDGVKSFELLRAWSVDVTGYDASYIPEYVSVGVVASPFFGAGIDGAKYFNTGWNGAPLTLQGFRREASAINNLLWSRDLGNAAWTNSILTGTPETIVGGDLSAFGSWSTNSGITISGGVANFATSSNEGLFQSNVITAGKTYITEFDVIDGNGANIFVFCGASTTTIQGTSGRKSIQMVASAAAWGFRVQGSFGLGFTGKIDNVSVKEAAIQCTRTIGLDGLANTATTLTATAADAIILQPISLASAARCASAYVKRRTGTGTISFTQDGTNWTDITAQINGSTWSRVQITSTLANPSVGFKISTSGDEIDVDCVQNEAGPSATSPIVTTTAAITRNADSLTYQTAGNIDFSVGTVFSKALSNISSATRGMVYVGSSYFGTTSASATTSFRINDGTTNLSKSGLSDISTESRKRAGSWGGDGLKLTGDGLAPSVGAFDGVFGNGALINIGEGLNGYIGPVAIWNYQMTDAQLQAITS